MSNATPVTLDAINVKGRARCTREELFHAFATGQQVLVRSHYGKEETCEYGRIDNISREDGSGFNFMVELDGRPYGAYFVSCKRPTDPVV
jgi:hypothetical protein